MIVDIVLIVFAALLALIGFKKGFFKSMVSLLGFILSLALAILLAKVVANALFSVNGIAKLVSGDKSLASWLHSKLPNSLEGISTVEIAAASDVGALFSGQSSWFEKLFYPIIKSGFKNPTYLAMLGNAKQIAALQLAYIIYTICVGIVLFLVIRIIAAIISSIFKKYTKNKPRLGSRSVGAVIGVVKATVYCMIIVAVLNILSGFSFTEKINEKISDSKIGMQLSKVSNKITTNLTDNDNEELYLKMIELSGFTDN